MAYSVGMGLLKTRYVFILMPDELRAEHCTAHSGGPHKRHGPPQACSLAGTSWRRGATARGGKRGSGRNGPLCPLDLHVLRARRKSGRGAASDGSPVAWGATFPGGSPKFPRMPSPL